MTRSLGFRFAASRTVIEGVPVAFWLKEATEVGAVCEEKLRSALRLIAKYSPNQFARLKADLSGVLCNSSSLSRPVQCAHATLQTGSR